MTVSELWSDNKKKTPSGSSGLTISQAWSSPTKTGGESDDWRKSRDEANARYKAPAAPQTPTVTTLVTTPAPVVATPTRRSRAEIQSELNTAVERRSQLIEQQGWYQGPGMTPTESDLAELERITDEKNTLDQRIAALEAEMYAEKNVYGKDAREDTFSGQFDANRVVGRLSQNSSKAWSEYMKNPTEQNKKNAQAYDAALEEFIQKNQIALDDENVKFGIVSQSFASYFPQWIDQLKAQAVGGLAGAAAGGLVGGIAGADKGAKMGAAAASAKAMYDLTAGAAFKRFLDMGIDEETARILASDEGIVQGIIEGGDTYLDWAFFGGKQLVSVAAKKFFPELAAKASTKAGKTVVAKAMAAVAKKLDDAPVAGILGGYVLNIGQEGLEEGSQEMVSLANDRRAQSGDVSGNILKRVWDLSKETFNVGKDLATGNDYVVGYDANGNAIYASQQVKEAAAEGSKIAVVAGSVPTATNIVIQKAFGQTADVKKGAQSDDTEQKVSPAADPEVQQTAVQAQVVQEQNPQAKVVDAATTIYVEQGMKLKTAQEKAEVVRKLVAGEEVSVREINKLDPTNKTAREIFTKLTGVQFPEGKLTNEQLYNLYRSAKDVAAEAQTHVAEAQAQQEARAQVTPEEVARRIEEARIGVAEEAAQEEETAQSVVTLEAFEAQVKQTPELTDMSPAEIEAAYVQGLQESGMTVRHNGKQLTFAEFAADLRSAPGGDTLTVGEIGLRFQQIAQRQNMNKEANYGRQSLLHREGLSGQPDQRSRGQSRGVSEETGRVEGNDGARRGDQAGSQAGRSGEVRALGQNQKSNGSYRTVKVNGNPMTEVRPEAYTPEMQALVDQYAAIGVNAHIVIEGYPMDAEGHYADGITILNTDGTTDVFLQVVGAHAMPERSGHEKAHVVLSRDPAVKEQAIAALGKAMSEKELLELVNAYLPMYGSAYANSEDLVGDLLEEIICDAYANLDRANAGAPKYHDAVSGVIEAQLQSYSASYGQDVTLTDDAGNLVVESDGNGRSTFSMSTYQDSGRDILTQWMGKAVVNGDLARQDADDIISTLDLIYDICEEARGDYAPFDAWSEAKVVVNEQGNPVFSVVKANGDYAMNLDFSLVCKKRRTLDAVLNELVKQGFVDNLALNEKQIVKINDLIRSYGFEVACDLCFVDAKRYRQGKVADDFVKLYNDLVQSMIPKGSGLKPAYFNFGQSTMVDNAGLGIHELSDDQLDFTKLEKVLKEKGEKSVEYKTAMLLKTSPADRKLTMRGDFLSTRGFDELNLKNPRVLKLFNSKKGSGGPKSAVSDVQYLNEVLTSKTFTPEKAYAVGGVRIQSFSDYVPRMVFDYVQMIADLAAKKLPAHAYTKEELFVKQFGLTGMKINMSLIPKVVDGGIAPGLDADGTYAWADESFDFAEAKKIQKAEGYSRNCGTIAVGVSDEHIRKLMADPEIRMVIPYHKSGLNPVVAKMNKINTFVNYTDFQNTRRPNGKNGKKLDKDVAADKKLLNEMPDFNTKMRELGDPRAAAEFYVRWCEENGLLPKFDQFAYKTIDGMPVERDGKRVVDENYYKLLEDFAVYDKGQYTEQTGLTMTFPTEDSAFGSMKRLILRGLSEDALLEAKRDADVPKIVADIKQMKFSAAGWKPNLDSAEWDIVKSVMNNGRGTDITSIDKMFFESTKGKSVFGIYSTDDDTLLYASRGKDASREHQFVTLAREEYENGRLTDTSAEGLRAWGEAVRVQLGANSGNVGDAVASGRLGGDANVYGEQPRLYASTALRNVLENIFKTEESRRANSVTEQPTQASEESGASSLPKTKYSAIDSTYAPVFYSKMERVVDAVKQEKLGAASVVSMLKGKGVKDEEIKWSGIEEWLSGKKSVTKQELLEFVRNSQLEIQEIVLDGSENHVSAEADEAVEDARLAIHNTQIRLRELNAAELFDDGRYDDADSHFDGWTVRTAANKRISAAFKERLSEDYKFLPDVLPVDTLLEFATTRGQNDAWADQVREWLETDEGKRLIEIRQLGEDLHEQYEDLDRASAVAQREARQGEPRWADYKLPGGENYREYLFRLPNIPYHNSAMDVHWGGRDSILAHARVQDIKADAGKMLFIEEIQSDWHNEGHQFGYKDTAASERAMEERQEAEAVMKEMRRQILPDLEEFYRKRGLDTPERAAETHLDMHYNNQLVDIFNKTYDFPETLQKQLNQYFELDRQAAEAHKRERALRRGVPDAPFRKNYHEFVLKNLIRTAAEGGYDSIGWTTGKMQEERWSSDYAEGYRIEYDQDIPKFLNKYGKQWGAKVGKTVIGNRDYAVETDSSVDMDDESWLLGEGIHIDGDEVWSMLITDEMKQSVLYEGQARYSVTPAFEKWYRENYGEELTSAQLKRRLQTAEHRAEQAEHDRKAAELKNTFDTELNLTAWMMHHTKRMREQKRAMNGKLAEARKEKTEAVRTAVAETKEVERAKAEVQHDADRMAERRNAAKRLRTREDAYKQKVTEMKENAKLKRNAARAVLRDSKLAAKRRAEIEAEQGLVDTIRKNPRQRTGVEKLQDAAQTLRTLGRSAYRNFVNMAEAIDRFSKRQAEGMRAGTLVNILGGTASTVESMFKKGLVDRAGNRIGESMSDVFLCWDEAHKKVNEELQAVLQDFMLHRHNIDRMSIVARAESALETFENTHEWLRDMDPKEFARLVAMTEKEAEKSGKQEAQLQAFQYARLIREYNEAQNKPIFKDDKGNPVTAETSQKMVDKYIAENPWLLEKANGIYEWWDKFMREWAVGDTISEAEYDRMRQMYPHYVPTYRTTHNGVGGAGFVGNGAASVSKAVKKAKGSTEEVMNIEDSFSNLISKIVRLNRLNEMYMNIVDTAMLDEDGLFSDMAYFDWDWQDGAYANALITGSADIADLTDTVEETEKAGLEKVGPDEFKLTAWRNGRKYTAYISKDLYQSIGNVTGHLANDLEEGLLKIGNTLTGPMKTAITGINPTFAVRNLSRDLPTAIINSISGLTFPKYYAQAAKEIAQNSEHWQQFQALGGTNATYYNDSQGWAKAMAKGKNLGSKAAGAMGAFNEVTESQTRFAEYLATVEKLGDTYENRLQGIKNAAEVTVDFSRKGRYGKVINAWVPYWNPAVQGIDKTIRSVIDSPDGSAVWKQASKTLGRAALTSVLLEAVLQAVLHGLDRDDEWEELNDRTKDTYYCIPLKDSKTFLKIPKNREWGAILGTPFMRMLEYANGRENPFENYIETSIEPNFLPPAIFRPDAGGGFTSDIIGVSQALDLAKNEDFAGRTIVPYSYQQGTLSQQYDNETSWFAKQLGGLLNWSPMQIDYILSDYFGDFGRMFIQATSKATLTGEQNLGKAALDIVTNPFVADARYSSYAVNKYYDLMDDLDRVVQDRKNLFGTDGAKETLEYQTQKAVDTLYGKAITELNRAVREMADGPEKDAAKEQIAQLAEAAVEFYNDSISGKIPQPELTANYANYSQVVSNELIQMDELTKEYNFKPRTSAPESYVDPRNKKNEFVLTEEQQEYYMELYINAYNEAFERVIQSSRYKNAKPERKAAMLEDVKQDAADTAKEELIDWLRKNGIRSTPKK